MSELVTVALRGEGRTRAPNKVTVNRVYQCLCCPIFYTRLVLCGEDERWLKEQLKDKKNPGVGCNARA